MFRQRRAGMGPPGRRSQGQRKPHVCPFCTGSGDVDDTQQADTALRAKQCPACYGEFVLWG